MNRQLARIQSGEQMKANMNGDKKSQLRKMPRNVSLAREERARRVLSAMPDFAVRLFGRERLRLIESPMVLQHWHD